MNFLKNTTRLLVVFTFVLSFSLATFAPTSTYAAAQPSTTKEKKPDKNKSTTKTVKQTKAISFKTEQQPDPNLPQGQTRVIKAGKKGTETSTYKVTYKNGKQTKKTLLSRKITTAPTTQIIGQGTYVAPPPPAPEPTPTPSPSPSGATAKCADGTLSYSAHRQGTCSHHGGVSVWY